MKALILALCVLFSCATYGGTIDPNTYDEKHLVYGAAFKCVGLISTSDTDGSGNFGSCVMIGDRVALTAAHMLLRAETVVVKVDKQVANVAKAFIAPDYTAKGTRGDLAVLFLDAPIKLAFYPELYDGADEAGKLVAIAGYGRYGTFATGATKFDGARRAGSNYIDYTTDIALVCSPSYRYRRTTLEFCIADGDSGGGLFIGAKLAGVNSLVMCTRKKGKPRPALGKYGHESAHTRVSRYRDWILKVIADEHAAESAP